MEFLYPSILWALSLILLPIIIHLFNLRRYKVVYFSNIKFIEDVKNKTKKRSQIKNLLILLSRILSILFIVFAFSQPYIPNKTNVANNLSKSNLVSIYIDNSFSMSAKGINGNLLNQSKNKAIDIIKAYNDNYRFIILNNNFSYSDFISKSKNEAINAIDNIELISTPHSISEVVKRHVELLKNQQLETSKLYCISDFQKTTTDIENIKNNDLQQIYFIQIKSENKNNLFIDSCWLEYPSLNLNRQNTLNVRIKNLSDLPFENIPLKLFINNRQEALSSFNINQSTFTDIKLPFTIKKTGINDAKLTIADYPITFDDDMFISFNVMAKTNIINIFSKDNVFINKIFEADSSFNLIKFNEKNIDYSIFGNAGTIVLNSLYSISSGLNQELVKYTEKGGNIIIIPASEIDYTSYKSFLSAINVDFFISSDTSKLKSNYINYDNYLLKDVFENIKKEISLPNTKLHYKLSVSNYSQADNLIKLINNDILVSSYKNKTSNIILFTTPIETKYSDIAIHPLFLPIIYNTALFGLNNNALYYNIGVENAIELNNINLTGDNIVSLINIKDKKEFIPEQRNNEFQTIIYTNNEINDAGNYNVVYNKNTVKSLSFNYNRNESDLRAFTEEEIDLIKNKNDLNITWIKNNEYNSIKQDIEFIEKGFVLWRILLVFAAFFILFEIILIRFLRTDGE
ncbi:MAG: hypothetical protein A2X12_11515 [Bacteroidetes bacterium GWE2_29_8]|nr:MAG: hypothetical protein A2X12_11515 [Bacteroidetes bacterium GWE2_29_8]OFY13970.1 MAG: hypothetical protein A2X02_09115 [Bacteroidetes bacterium GWF2_29_10]